MEETDQREEKITIFVSHKVNERKSNKNKKNQSFI
jgi:hypothetical protein